MNVWIDRFIKLCILKLKSVSLNVIAINKEQCKSAQARKPMVSKREPIALYNRYLMNYEHQQSTTKNSFEQD